MLQSQVIEVAGRFVGAAIFYSGKFRFVAVDPRVEELDGSEWGSLPDIKRVAAHLVVTGRLPVPAQANVSAIPIPPVGTAEPHGYAKEP